MSKTADSDKKLLSSAIKEEIMKAFKRKNKN
jgi:hypothetical protein